MRCTLCPLGISDSLITNCMRGLSETIASEVMFVGEAPGRVEDELGKPFTGEAGRMLRREMREAAIDAKGVFFTHVARCRPPQSRPPKAKEAQICSQNYLEPEIEAQKPKLIVAVGATAMKAVLGNSGVSGTITKWRGRVIRVNKKFGVVAIIPILHPAYVLHESSKIPLFKKDLATIAKFIKSGYADASSKGRLPIIDIKTAEDFEAWRVEFKTALAERPISYDTETRHDKVFCISFCDGKHVWWLDTRRSWWSDRHVKQLRELLEIKKSKEIIAHFCENDDQWMRDTFGIKINTTYDTARAYYAMDAARSSGDTRLSLKVIAETLLDMGGYEDEMDAFLDSHALVAVDGERKVIPIGDVKEAKKSGATVIEKKLTKKYIYLAPTDILRQYSCADAEATYKIYKITYKYLLREKRLLQLFRRILMPGARALRQVTHNGILVDTKRLMEIGKELRAGVAKVEQKLYAMPVVKAFEADKLVAVNAKLKKPVESAPFKPRSARDVGAILFGDRYYGLHPLVLTKTGANATGAPVLAEMVEKRKTGKAGRFIRLLLEHRDLSKQHSTYVVGMSEEIKPDGRIRGRFINVGTETGRLASRSPNMQNLPKTDKSKVKEAFIARPGFAFVEADLSQVELRVAAMLSGDKKLCRAFRLGLDMHTQTAKDILGIAEPTPEQRRIGKGINFTVWYGGGAAKVARATGVAIETAQGFIRKTFRIYSGYAAFRTEVETFVKKHGCITSPFGRIRALPEVYSGDERKVGHALRQAVNAPIQATASDILMLGLIELVKRQGRRRGYYVVGTVHDSILFEVEEARLGEVLPKIKKTMEGVKLPFPTHKVPIIVDIKRGKNWGELNAVKL